MAEKQLHIDLIQGQLLRDRGLALSAMPKAELLHLARETAYNIARIDGEVTSDDVRQALNIVPGRANGANWIGSIFRDKRFEWTGRVISSKIPKNHAALIKIWKLK